MPTPVDLVTDLPADFEVFGQAVDTSLADLLGGTTGQILAKASNSNMDFAWITNDVGDITAVNVTSPITGGGSSGAVTIAIQDATTSVKGAVQLSDSTSTTSSVLASTPTATKAAYDLAAAATPKSTFTGKGSIAAATAASTPANLTVGNNGEALVADSSTATGLRYNAQSNANLIAGGSFDIWQRGTGAFTTNGVYSSDRLYTFSSTNYSLSQETSVIPDGATNAVKVTATAASSFANLQFALEQSEVEKLAGQTVTFSVYLRANATYNGAFLIEMKSNTTGNTQTGGTWTTVSGASTTHTPSTSAYTRVKVTGTIPTSAKGLAFYIGQNAVLASGSIYYIALAKAELGSVATPFSRLGVSIAGELASCQRYYFRATIDNIGGRLGSGYVNSTIEANITIPYPVTMRIRPTALEQNGTAADYQVLTTGNTITNCNSVPSFVNAGFFQGVVALGVASGLVAGQGATMRVATANSYLGWSAEL